MNKKNSYQKFLEKKHNQFSTPDEIINEVIKELLGETVDSKKRITKGEENEVYDIKTNNNLEVILRISRREDFSQEKWAIKECQKIGIPVPEILGISRKKIDNKDLFFCIQRKMEGETLERGGIDMYKMDKEELRKIINQAGEILAKIHSIKVEGFEQLNGKGVGKFKSFEEMMMEKVDQEEFYLELADRVNLDREIMLKALHLLVSNKVFYHSVESVLNHGDFAPKHLMIKENKIVGVLDFGQVNGNTPIADIARWDYWYESYVPVKWLEEGYSNKEIFNKDYKIIFNLLNIRSSLILIYWYELSGFPEFVERSKRKLIEYLEFFK